MRIVADGHEAVPAVSGIDEAVRAGLDQAAGAGGAVALLKVNVSVVWVGYSPAPAGAVLARAVKLVLLVLLEPVDARTLSDREV